MNKCNYNIKQTQKKITYSYKYKNNYINILICIWNFTVFVQLLEYLYYYSYMNKCNYIIKQL